MVQPSHSFRVRQLHIRQNAEKWQASARASGLLNATQAADPQRAGQQQSATSGVSIDWLHSFSKGLRELPLLPTETYAVVRDVIHFCTSGEACRLVDLIPAEHVGYPTHYIVHNWNSDFHSMVDALVTDFSKRWNAHLAYKMGKARDWRHQMEDKPEDEKEAADALAAERKKLAGYYVWIDIAAINQHVTSPLDPASVLRLITVIGRTVLVLEDNASVLTRLWCCYELWTTIKAARTIIALRVQPETGCGMEDIAKVNEEAEEEDPEDVAERLPMPDLSSAKTSVAVDKASILATLQLDLVSPKIKAKTLNDIGKEVRHAVMGAVVRELQKPALLKRLYAGLTQCCKVYTDVDVSPGYTQVDQVRKALRELINLHYRKEATRAKLLSQEDPELETWECLSFLEKEFERQREEDSWLQEVKRVSKLTLHSYATRFSNGYVNGLMRQAGTCDDMRVLSQYVHQQCRVKTIAK